MKVLALDHGEARTGVAISDPTGTIARPLPPISRIATPAGQAALDQVIAEHEPELVLIGEPRLMSGQAGRQADVVRSFAGRLRARIGLPVELMDERLTTVEAGRRATEGGSTTSLDSLSACVLLEAFLMRR